MYSDNLISSKEFVIQPDVLQYYVKWLCTDQPDPDESSFDGCEPFDLVNAYVGIIDLEDFACQQTFHEAIHNNLKSSEVTPELVKAVYENGRTPRSLKDVVVQTKLTEIREERNWFRNKSRMYNDEFSRDLADALLESQG